MIWTVCGTKVGNLIDMSGEYEWRAEYCNPNNMNELQLVRFIDSRFIDVISGVAWQFGFNIVQGTSKGRVRIPGETHVYINEETREVDFSEVPQEMEEDVALAVQEAMEKFNEWEAKLKGEEY